MSPLPATAVAPSSPPPPQRPPDGLGAKTAFTLMSAVLSVPLALYNLLLVERKWGVLLAWDRFFSSFRLSWWETALYIADFFLAALVLTVTLSGLARCLLGRWAAFAVALSYFFLVTAQFEVLRYFRDELSLAVVRKFGGGRIETALAYLGDEAAAVVPFTLLLLAAMVFARNMVRRYFRLASIWLGRRWFIRQLATTRGLLAANLLMAASVPAVAMVSHPAHNALELSLAHRVYAAAVDWASDVDRDGYGWLAASADFAPWDATRHPYALEIAGNGIDENGIGGDLPFVTAWPSARRPPAAPWNPAAVDRKNVLLIVMDSARRDLAGDAIAMPSLNALPGPLVPIVSHGGRTVPSVTGMLNGTIAETEPAVTPLLDNFHKLGYQTAVFSGQHEGFGGIAPRTRMHQAGTFFDASLDLAHRMHGGTTPAALTVPAPVVNARFKRWLTSQRDPARPFFAYLNWQEMHFPYAYSGAPRLLLDNPIPRASITARNRDWTRATYRNSARALDSELAAILPLLDLRNTLLVIVGDHGEELFDRGYLGHGIDISIEQNMPLCKLSGALGGGNTGAPRAPIGISDLPVLIYNALALNPDARLPFHPAPPLCYIGAMDAPAQIGIAEPDGAILKYDFAKDNWSRQSRFGAEFTPAAPDHRVIHLWESYLVAQ